MEKPDEPLYSIRYTIPKKDIQEFLDHLHTMQFDYLEQAVEASKYKDAQAVIARIMEMK
jgi:hypothetical protein